MARLWLIRHGRPAAGWGGADDDPGLDAVGQEQAAGVARALAALAPAERPTGIVSSPLARCRETALPLAEALDLPVEIDPGVGEIPTPRHLVREARGPWLQTSLAGLWRDIKGDLDYEAWRRAVFAAVLPRERTAVFSHFVAINAVLSILAGEDRVIVHRPDHAAIITIEVADGTPRLIDAGAEGATRVL